MHVVIREEINLEMMSFSMITTVTVLHCSSQLDE